MALLSCSGALFCGCVSSAVRYSSAAHEPHGHSGQRAEHGGRKAPEGKKSDAAMLRQVATSYLGAPYRYGGISKQGVDCSGFVCLVFRDLGWGGLPHSARKLRRLGTRISLGRAGAGDLLFFRMGFAGLVDHVGIYLGEGRFIHASSKLGVIESGMDDEYYRSRFIEARRIFP
jgi:cell wall-associated NlpC family hydrolase